MDGHSAGLMTPETLDGYTHEELKAKVASHKAMLALLLANPNLDLGGRMPSVRWDEAVEACTCNIQGYGNDLWRWEQGERDQPAK